MLASHGSGVPRMRALLLLTAGVVLGATSGAALAHGYYYGPQVGIAIGVPGFWYGPPYYYPPPFAYPPAIVVVPRQTYVPPPPQPMVPPVSPPAVATWYYCPESKAYYPYVAECPGGWQSVPAQPPPPNAPPPALAPSR